MNGVISRYTAYENALGVRTMAWSSSGEFLAVGSFDNSARLLNSFTWRNVAEYPHPRTASSTNGVFVYEEITIVDNPSGRVGEAAGAQVGVQGGAMVAITLFKTGEATTGIPLKKKQRAKRSS